MTDVVSGGPGGTLAGGARGRDHAAGGRPVLEAVGVVAGYRPRRRQAVPVLRDVGIGLRRGELACLLGPNGAGKSTLLRTLVGSQPPLGGTVRLLGDDIARLSARERAQRLSVVLTDRVDVGLLRVRDLVGLGRAPRTGWLASAGGRDREVVAWALHATGAEGLVDRFVTELSDGERQRVMVARALAQEPAVIVLDEPTAFLDVVGRVELVAVLEELVRAAGLAVVLSTHDLDLALRTADVLWLVQPDGVLRTGAPEDLALDGSLASAYRSGAVAFDADAGTFTTRRRPGPLTVRVDAHGAVATWARRAAERSGVTVTDDVDIAALHVAVSPIDGGPAWSVAEDCASGRAPLATGRGFAGLVTALRRLARTTDPSDPSDPTDPTDPIHPTDPTDPIHPTPEEATP